MQIIRCDSEKKLKRVIEEYSQFHVYGAGDIGKRVVRYLLKNNISNKNIKVVVTGASTQKALFGNVVIESVSKVASINKDTLTIISARGTTRDEMLETAQQYYSNIAIVEDTLCDELERKVRIPRNKLKFEVHLAEHCNLNCKSCFHYSSIAKEEYLDIVEYERDCKRLAELFCGEMQQIVLLGGEPLLHPNVEKVIEITRNYFRKGEIVLVTNGLLLPKMPESFWNTCHDKDVTIEPTKYPINLDYDLIESMAEKYCIKYRYFNGGEVEKTLWFNPLDLSGSQNIVENFDNCYRGKACITLKKGRLYTCIMPAHIHLFCKYFEVDLPDFEEDGIDIYEAETADAILHFLIEPISMCAYCDRARAKGGFKWETTKREITEWV